MRDNFTGLLAMQSVALVNKLIKPSISTTLTEPISVLHYDQLDDGTPLSAKRLHIEVFVPAGSSVPSGTITYLRARVNEIATGYQDTFGVGGANKDYMVFSPIRNLFGAGSTDLCVLGSGVVATCLGQNGDSSTLSRGTFSTIHPTANIQAINDLYCWVDSGYTMPAGTVINIWVWEAAQ